MSSLFKKFLTLLGVEEIKLADKINIKILSGNNKYEITKNVINLDYSKLSKEEKREFLESMKKLRESDDYLVMENKSFEVVGELSKIDDGFNQIKKLKQILTVEDYSALEDSVYIDYLSKKDRREEIGRYKQQIIRQFGQRGNTICNLYTAGYFHGIFLPLYDDLSKKDGGLEEFKLTFDKLIRDFPLAIFINHLMTTNDVKTLIKNKVTNNIKYGIKKLHIHGINETNCKNIREAIKILQEEAEITFTITESEEKNSIILVTLEF